MSVSKLQEIVEDREAWCAAVHGVAKSWTQHSEWTTTNSCSFHILKLEFYFCSRSRAIYSPAPNTNLVHSARKSDPQKWAGRFFEVTQKNIAHPLCSTGFPGGSDSKESACDEGDLGLIPGLGRSPGSGVATHSSILAWRISMDRGVWWATVHEVTNQVTKHNYAVHISLQDLGIKFRNFVYYKHYGVEGQIALSFMMKQVAWNKFYNALVSLNKAVWEAPHCLALSPPHSPPLCYMLTLFIAVF